MILEGIEGGQVFIVDIYLAGSKIWDQGDQISKNGWQDR